MFDWFREVAQEMNGIDSVAAKKERMEKREQKKLNRFIFSPGMKALTIALAVIYIIMAASSIGALRNTVGAMGVIVKFVFMSIVAIVVIFALLFGKKKGEIVALAGAFIFVVGLFLSTALM